ncbi:MAG: hypothetical protein K6T74_15135 [Geminicoccaceae bacterium]|nr:hypothetical protein [Geminicoccaceae bacterium]
MTTRPVGTRRALVLGSSFGILGLYGIWAALDLAPWPWAGTDGHGGHGSEGGHGAAGGHGGVGGGPSPEEFRALTREFVLRYRLADGTVRPGPAPGDAPAAPDPHVGHGAASGLPTAAVPDPHAGHGSAAAPAEAAPAGSTPTRPVPVEVYLAAFQWGFEPQILRLEVGRPYRFRMMAVDVAHGAALQLGPASRIIRLRPGVLVEQELTFTRPGDYLVYCTVFCGPGHELMAGRLLVA